MILPGQMIRMRGIFSPFSKRQVHEGLSYGLSCAGYDVRLKEDVTLVQGYTVIGVTLEHMDFPPDLLGMVADKSTLARKGVQVQHTVIEPGWHGYLAVELTYQPVINRSTDLNVVLDPDHLPEMLEIKAGTPIAQVLIHQLLAPAEAPYGTFGGKYQSQSPEDIGPKLETWAEPEVKTEEGRPLLGPSYVVSMEEADRLKGKGWDVNWDKIRQCWVATDERSMK